MLAYPTWLYRTLQDGTNLQKTSVSVHWPLNMRKGLKRAMPGLETQTVGLAEGSPEAMAEACKIRYLPWCRKQLFHERASQMERS